MGNGVVVAGGIGNTIERNLIYDHDKTGIALVPFLEEGANDDLPGEDEWTQTCADQREQPLADEIPEQLLWEPYGNTVRDNVISDSRVADIGVEAVSEPTGGLEQLLHRQRHHVVGTGSARDARTVRLGPRAGRRRVPGRLEPLNVLTWLADAESAPPSVDYEIAELPPIPDLDDMPDAATAPAEPAINMPRPVDVDAITTPTR